MFLLPSSSFFYVPHTSLMKSQTVPGWVDQTLSGSSGRDNGAIAGMMRILQGNKYHSSTAELVEKLAPHAGGSISIAGHGTGGYFETGAGQWGGLPEDSVESDTEFVWGPLFERLKTDERSVNYKGWPNAVLTLWCCSVLKHPSGYALAKRISEITNRTVRAYPALIYVSRDGISYQRTKWDWENIVADKFETAFSSPSYKAPATPALNLLRGESSMHAMGFDLGMEASNVKSFLVSAWINQKFVEKEISGDAAGLIFPELFFSKPFQRPGISLARMTAKIVINYKSGPALEYHAYADSIAEEVGSSRTFLISENFTEVLGDLLA
jgi:hypothetical protein